MDATNLHEYISTVTHLLEQRESKDAEAPYWFLNEWVQELAHDHPAAEYDEAMSLCWVCIHEIEPDAKSGEHYGGGYCTEEDGCEACEKCGKLLDYTLTDYGVSSELEHFTADDYEGFDWNSAPECYEMARIAGGLWTDEQKQLFVKAIEKSRNKPAELTQEAPDAQDE